MVTNIIQYIIIGALFIAAVIFIVRRTMGSANGNKGCSKGCGCEFNEEKQKKAIY